MNNMTPLNHHDISAAEVEIDRLAKAPGRMGALHFTLTNKCNLRCVYCPQGSHPDGYHADVDEQFIEEILAFIRDKQIVQVGIGYYGEMILVENWWQVVNRLADAGCILSGTSNFSRVLTPDELATFSRFSSLQISIDTVDIGILKRVRKAIDVRTIVYNTLRLRALCLAAGRPGPDLMWTGVLTDQVVGQLPDTIAMAAAAGIRSINFNDVTYFSGAPGGARNVSELSGQELQDAVRAIITAYEMAQRFSLYLNIQGIPRIQAKLDSEALGKPLDDTVVERLGIQGTFQFPNDQNYHLQPGQTRDCVSPWHEMYLDPKGDVFSCCVRGEIMGRFGPERPLSDVWQDAKYTRIRRSLLTGQDLDSTCALCNLRGAIPVAALQAKVAALVGSG